GGGEVLLHAGECRVRPRDGRAAIRRTSLPPVPARRGGDGVNVALGTLPAEPDQQNEDFAATAPGAAVLLDGAGVAGAETGCVHGIAWFSSTLGGLLLGNIAQDSARPLADCLADALRGVRSLHEDTCDLTYRASPTSTVV